MKNSPRLSDDGGLRAVPKRYQAVLGPTRSFESGICRSSASLYAPRAATKRKVCGTHSSRYAKKFLTMASPEIAPRYQIGARVRVNKDVTTMPALPAYVGIVKEIIPSFVDNTIGYNLALEDDPRPKRLWFFLQQQLTPA